MKTFLRVFLLTNLLSQVTTALSIPGYDDDKYNEAAVRVMKKHGIEINDLNTLTDSFPPELFTAPGNVHFKTEGSKKLGQAVAEKITEALGR